MRAQGRGGTAAAPICGRAVRGGLSEQAVVAAQNHGTRIGVMQWRSHSMRMLTTDGRPPANFAELGGFDVGYERLAHAGALSLFQQLW